MWHVLLQNKHKHICIIMFHYLGCQSKTKSKWLEKQMKLKTMRLKCKAVYVNDVQWIMFHIHARYCAAITPSTLQRRLFTRLLATDFRWQDLAHSICSNTFQRCWMMMGLMSRLGKPLFYGRDFVQGYRKPKLVISRLLLCPRCLLPVLIWSNFTRQP